MSWTRDRILGKGSDGVVSIAKSSSSPWDYLELDVGLDQKFPPLFAVKSAEYSRSQPLQDERVLLNEIRDCPNIIHCYGADASEEDGVILYNMMLEYAAGGSLLDRINDSGAALLEDEVKRYTKSVLKGLSYMHCKGFAHCDIKPANILLVEDGSGSNVAKIADFGLAIKVRKSTRKRRRQSKIDWRGWWGTAVYMAPESILCYEYGFGVDIWALGCTVFQMLTKKLLRNINSKDKNKVERLVQMAKQRVEIPHELSKDAKDFLEKCLINDPTLRWTADMLLKHPFVSYFEAKEEEETSLTNTISETEASTLISSRPCHDDLIQVPEEEEDLEWLTKPMLLINPTSALHKRKRLFSEADSVSESSSKKTERLDLDRVVKPLGRGLLQACY